MTTKPIAKNPPANGWQARWFHFTMWMAILTIFVLFLRAVEPILLPFVLGMCVAYLMDPLVRRLQRYGMGRTSATAIITVALFTTIVALFIWLSPIAYNQLADLLNRAPGMLRDVEVNGRIWAAPLLQKLNAISGAGPNAIPADTNEIIQRGLRGASQLTKGIFTSGAALMNVIALLLITPVVCFYLIRDWPGVVRRMNDMLPRAYADTIREQILEINRTLASYVRGQLTVMIILSVFYIFCFMIIGLNYALVLGLVAGCIVIIPYIGSAISVVMGLIVAYGQYEVSTAFWFVVAVYAAGQVLESQILTPKIIGDRVGLHPLWMLFGMLSGAVLLGFVGVLLAVPLTAVIGVLVKFAVRRYLESGLYLST